MLTWPPSHHTLGQLARPRGRPDVGNRPNIRGRQWSYSRPDAGKVGTPACKRTPHCKDSKHGGRVRWHADLPSRALNHHSSGRALTLYREDHGRASAHGPEPASACSANSEAEHIY
ncbi:hypothetical protein GW17_00010096 [Ensete ventricosum]|nr:hypothetical protein GW17_00010096 [Ensete ventricosum]